MVIEDTNLACDAVLVVDVASSVDSLDDPRRVTVLISFCTDEHLLRARMLDSGIGDHKSRRRTVKSTLRDAYTDISV